MSFTSWLRIQALRRANRATRIVCAAVGLAAAMALMAPHQAAAVDTEPLNNSQLTADSLNLLPGTAVSNLAQLSGDSGDVDFFQTPLAAGEVFFGIVTPNTDLSSLDMPPGFILPDTIVSVFDDSGQRTLSDQDYADELTIYNLSNGSLFRFEAPATANYRVGVAGSSDLDFEGVALDPFNETGAYALTAGRINPAVPGGGFVDTDPENQTAAGADLIDVAPGTARVAVLQLGESDVDFFRLDLKAGDVLSAITAPLGDPGNSFDLPDTVLGLFDSSGANLLVENDNAGWEFDTHSPLASDFPDDGGDFSSIWGSALRALIPTDGTYYLAVTGSGDSDYAGAHAASGAYALLVGVPAVVVPEPATVALICIALVGLSAASRRRAGRNVVHHAVGEICAPRIVCAAVTALAAITLTAPSASAEYITVYGGPTFAADDGVQFVYVAGVNDAGMAVGNISTEASALDASFLVVRWDSSGAPAIELGLGGATDINEAGAAVGYLTKFVGTGDPTTAAVRWDASGAATELMILGTPPCCGSFAYAYSINDAGVAVGGAEKYASGGSYMGYHAARWDPSGTAANELETYGTSSASAINSGGTAVGSAEKYDAVLSKGRRAVRWNGSDTPATELGNLGTDASGYTDSFAVAINNAGTSIGYADRGGYGFRAVRWDASSAAATELGTLGFSAFFGYTESYAVAINDAGVAVGYAYKYDGSGLDKGLRAVRWDASGTAATELGNLGTDASGNTNSIPADINDIGITIGYADHYDGSGTNLGERAVYWGLDGLAVDLNTLIDPASGWTLNQAHVISNTGWIGGSAAYDPDGPGGQEPAARLFLMQVSAKAPADFDGDGDVDADDLAQWQRDFGFNSMSDADNDLDSDGADFLAWQRQFSPSPAVVPANAAVPEPATSMLVVVAAVVICRIGGRTRQELISARDGSTMDRFMNWRRRSEKAAEDRPPERRALTSRSIDRPHWPRTWRFCASPTKLLYNAVRRGAG